MSNGDDAMSDQDRIDHQQRCGGDVAAYALGALDDAEAERFGAHLETCAVCRDEFLAFQQIVDVLPMGAPPFHAPRGLRRRVHRAVAEEARGAGARPRRARRSWVPRPTFALGALATAAVAAVVIVLAVGSTSGPTTRVIQARVVGQGTAALSVQSDHAHLVVDHLPAAGAGRTYEVWLQRGSTLAPANALFDPDHGHADVTLDESMHGVSRLLVTSERAGGTSYPTRSPVITAALS